MIHEIKECRELIPYLKEEIKDEGIEVGVEEGLVPEKMAAIKMDDYYNNLHVEMPPKSIDFLVVVDCECSWYALYLLELKNVNSPKKLSIKDIQDKFETAIDNFMSARFEKIFLCERYKYKDIKLYLVSDAYGLNGKYGTFEEYKKIQERRQKIQNRDSLRVDRNLGSKLYKFRGKIYKINYEIPPNPIIKKIS